MTLPLYIAAALFTAGLTAFFAWLLASHRVRFRQRTLWIAVFVAALMSAVLWNGLEVRFDGSDFYWRSDWGWSGGPGGIEEVVAEVALYAAPLLAAGIAVAGSVAALARRISSRWLRPVPYLLGVPFVPLIAFGLSVGTFMLPYLFWSERSD